MKTIKYGTDTLTTSDQVADALMVFAASLRGSDSGQLLNVPTVDPDGTTATVSIVVAHGTPLLSRPSVSEYPDPESSELIAQMQHLAGRHGTLRVDPEPGPPDSDQQYDTILGAD